MIDYEVLSKQKERDRIASETEAFLEGGGVIQCLSLSRESKYFEATVVALSMKSKREKKRKRPTKLDPASE